MRPKLPSRWPGRVAALGLIFLTLGIGCCLFDADELGPVGHVASPDLCSGLALFSFSIAFLALAAVGRVSPLAAELVLIPSMRRLDPPPRALFL